MAKLGFTIMSKEIISKSESQVLSQVIVIPSFIVLDFNGFYTIDKDF